MTDEAQPQPIPTLEEMQAELAKDIASGSVTLPSHSKVGADKDQEILDLPNQGLRYSANTWEEILEVERDLVCLHAQWAMTPESESVNVDRIRKLEGKIPSVQARFEMLDILPKRVRATSKAAAAFEKLEEKIQRLKRGSKDFIELELAIHKQENLLKAGYRALEGDRAGEHVAAFRLDQLAESGYRLAQKFYPEKGRG